jgi:hypothetical protein
MSQCGYSRGVKRKSAGVVSGTEQGSKQTATALLKKRKIKPTTGKKKQRGNTTRQINE